MTIPFNFNYQTTPLLFFLVQGLVFSILILRKALRHDDVSGRWLALFVSLSCLYIIPWMCGYSNWYAMDGYREFLFFVPFQQLFLLGPALYFYVLSLLNSQFRFRPVDWWHFLPGILYLIYSLVIFLYDQFLVADYYFYADGRDKDMASWYQISGFISMLFYTILSIRYYGSYRLRIYRELSYADAVTFTWVKKFLVVLLGILLLRLIFFLLYPGFGNFGPKWWYYLCFSALGYYIAIMGYSNTVESLVTFRLTAFTDPKELLSSRKKVTPGTSLEVTTDEPDDMDEKILDNAKASILRVVVDQQQFRNPTLTLTDLATELSITSKQVSRIINRGFNQNFNDFINSHRIEAVKKAFTNGDHHQRTILGVALECGFNSKTTFNRVFKKMTGITPLTYLKKKNIA